MTIGIPTFNRAGRTLPDALRSALDQTYRNLQIVVSDNCSTDHTPELVKNHDDPRIKYVRHDTNIGANANFNACVQAADGDYFLLLHDDDLIDPDFVETCMDAAGEAPSVGVIRTGIRLIDGEGEVLLERCNMATGDSMADLVFSWFANRTAPYCANTLLHTETLKSVGGFRSRHNLFQDVLAQMRVAARRGWVNVRDVKASFRRHDNMGSSAAIRHWCEDSLDLLEVLCELTPDRADEVRAEGMRFFCLMNYTYVEALRSPVKRWLCYMMVARMFDFSYPPLRYAFMRDFKQRLRLFKRRWLGNAASPATR